MDIENISRRSFLKKTTVLTVGVASMTLFSGLVNAATTYTCASKGTPSPVNGVVPIAQAPGYVGPPVYSAVMFDVVECFDSNRTSLGFYHTNIQRGGPGGNVDVNTLPIC